jgi:predicted nucleic acid-binding protein
MRSCSGSVTVTVADAYVVDTGVFIRWFLDQDGFEHARELRGRLASGTATAETVDFARIEVAGVLRKKGLLTGRFTVDEFTTAVRLIDDIGVRVHATTADRLERAAELAAGKMLGMYDALFVQLARELELPLLTSDAKLGRAVAGTIQVEVLQGVGEQALPGEVPTGGETARREQPVRGARVRGRP